MNTVKANAARFVEYLLHNEICSSIGAEVKILEIPEKIIMKGSFYIELTVVDVVWRRAPASATEDVVPQTEPDSEAGKTRFRVNEDVPPPRRGSMNFAVWELALKLPAPFSRSQFESVVPSAMQYDAVNHQFGVPTKFPSIRRASQAYFSEFRKRRWIVEA